jgi:uncharacterized FlaG/YvyC family protein
VKKIFLISGSVLALVACGQNEQTETDETNEETEVTEPHSGQENKEQEKEETSDVKKEESESDLTEEEAEEQVIEYIEEMKPEIESFLSSYQFMVEEKEDKYQVKMFSPESADENIGSPLLSSYEVNRTTGEVKEIEPEIEGAEPYISEVATMSIEAREGHHRELAADEENLENKVFDHLMLPGLHENTETYEGRINPDGAIELFLATADDPPYLEDLDVVPEVDEEGYFSIDLRPYDLKNKAYLRVSIHGDYSKAQTFDLPIFEAEEGMESISVRK